MSINLNKEEKELLHLFEQGKLTSADDSKSKIKIAKIAAANHFKKDARINIRISKFDLDRIKKIAAIEGLPYQTLISSVLHKLVNNNL